MQSAYCSRFRKIKNWYKKRHSSNYYFEEINFNVFFCFPRRTSIGAICLLQSLPKKIKNLYKKHVFLTTTLRKSISMCFLFSPEDVNRCNLLIAVASKKSRICKKKICSNYYFEEINFTVFFYFPRTSSIGAICFLQSLLKNQEFVQFFFSNYYFEEINFNVFFYFPRRTSIGAICLLQSLPKNQEFAPKIIFF